MNRGWTYVEQVGAAADGVELVAFLAERHRHGTPADWAARVSAGEVTVAGGRVDAGCRLRRGQRVAWERPPWEEPDVPLAFDVVHRDEHVLVVHKPGGLPTMPAGGFLEHTLLALVRAHDPDATSMHRLGRGTSGLVAFGLTALARSSL